MSGNEKKNVQERQKEEVETRKVEEENQRWQMEEKRLGRFPGGSQTSISSIPESETDVERRKRSREDVSPEKSRKKRTEVDEDDEENEYGDNPLKNVEVGADLVSKWLRQPSIQRLVTKPQQKKLETILKRMREDLAKCREERVKVMAQAEERGNLAEIVRKTVREELKKEQVPAVGPVPGSYASVVGRKDTAPKVPKVTGVKGPVQPTPRLVIIKHEKKESEEVKATLKKLVKPSEIGLKVKRLTSIRNGVIVEADSDEGAENLIKHQALQSAGLKVGRPTKKRPVVMIYDVSAELKEEEIKEEVFSRNMRESEVPEEEFKQEFEIRHKYKDSRSSGKKCHIVVECSVRVRNWLRSRERLFIEWQSCRVKDYADVARCYKCQRFGHVAKHCSTEKPGCSYCAGEHDYKECKHKNDKGKVCCINCKREGRVDDKHDAGSRKCPSYEKAVKRENEKIDYGL